MFRNAAKTDWYFITLNSCLHVAIQSYGLSTIKTETQARDRDNHACAFLLALFALFLRHPVAGAHQQEPLFPIISLGVNPFPSRFIRGTVFRGGFARTQFKDPIKTELDRVYCFMSLSPLTCTFSTLAIVLKIILLWKGLIQEISGDRGSY